MSTLLAVGLAALGFLLVAPSAALVPVCYLAAVTPQLGRTDIAEHRLPNRLVLPGYLAGAVGLVLDWLRGTPPGLALASGAAFLLLMLLMNLAGGMGMGDVKLAGVLGLSLGMLGMGAAITGPALAFLAGGIGGLVVLVLRRAGWRSRIPFGPFMLGGFWAALVPTGLG
ncbi:MAG: prepilin peptidase [Lacisediminihabitans sp.]